MRDAIRGAGLGYDQATSEVMDGPEPMPRCGNFFVSVCDGKARGDADNALNEWYGFSVSLTMRIGTGLAEAPDRGQATSNLARRLARRTGWYARVEELRALLHMNWRCVVLTNQAPPSANDNLAAWASGAVYGFVEPPRCTGPVPSPRLVGGEWFAAEPDAEDVGITGSITFDRCRRMQPQTLSVGPFA